MEIAKIITDGNTRMVTITLPEDFSPDNDEVEIDKTEYSIRITPRKRTTVADIFEILSEMDKDVADAIMEARRNDFQPERDELI